MLRHRLLRRGFTDPYYDNVILLLKADDALTDLSKVASTITAYGNAAVNSSTKYFGAGSLALDGSGDYIVAAPASPPDNFVFSTNPFTVEAFIYVTGGEGVTNRTIISCGTSALSSNWQFSLSGSSILVFFHNANSSITSGTDVISLNTWTHVAVSYDGSTLRLFINGVLVRSEVFACNYSGYTQFRIGINRGSSVWFPGYIDSLRVTSGIGRYTQNFVPPTTDFAQKA